MFQFEFYNPVRTVFGTGTFETAGRRIADLGKHALLVNYRDPGPLRPVLEKAARLCKEAGVTVTEFFAFEENPAVETVAEGVALARRQGCDVVVGIGGGSAMDGAKAIAAGCHYEGDLWDMVYHRHDGSGREVWDRICNGNGNGNGGLAAASGRPAPEAVAPGREVTNRAGA